MSVEAVPPPAEAHATATVPTPTAAESEIVALLKEQNALLCELLASLRPHPDPKIERAEAVAAAAPPVEGNPYIAVDTETGEHAVGRTIGAAADALGTPPGRSLVMRAGGRPVRIQTPRIGGL